MESRAYIYDVDTREVVAVIDGPGHRAIMAKANEEFGSRLDEELGLTYSPAFGFADGLTDNKDADYFEIR